MFNYRVEIITGIGPNRTPGSVSDPDHMSSAIDRAQNLAAECDLPVTIVTGEGYMEPYPAEPVLVVTTYAANVGNARLLADRLREAFNQDSVVFARSEAHFELIGGES
jgi:hypothetical protein